MLIQRELESLCRTPGKRLALMVPVRHGKSELATVRHAAWRLERDPGIRIVIACYSQQLANQFSRKVRRIILSRVGVAPGEGSVHDWRAANGSSLRAVGVGGGITGQGFDLLIVDDPVKSRAEAESPRLREKVWEWYIDDLSTRREPGACTLLIQSRWHEDDLIGRVLQSAERDDWTSIRLPALAEPGDPLGRTEGEPLCPERYDRAQLLKIREQMGEYGFNALFQQRPFARQGMMFLRERVEVVAAAPARAVALCRAWDLAASAGRGDFTASVLIGRLADDRFIVLDAQRKQLGSADRDRWIRQTAELDGNGVQIRLPQEPGAAGRSLAEHLARLLSGFRVVIERITGSKVVRAEPFASQWNAGNVLLLRGDWNRVFLDELCSFPAGRNDDLVDAAADAFSQVAKVGKRPAAW